MEFSGLISLYDSTVSWLNFDVIIAMAVYWNQYQWKYNIQIVNNRLLTGIYLSIYIFFYGNKQALFSRLISKNKKSCGYLNIFNI